MSGFGRRKQKTCGKEILWRVLASQSAVGPTGAGLLKEKNYKQVPSPPTTRPEWGTRLQTSKLMVMIAAFVWHWWLAPILTGSAALFIVASVGGYLSLVTKDRYPRRAPRRD